jgi:hypothetical protein
MLPAAATAASIQSAIEVVNPMDELVASVNSSPYFVGTMMLLLNLGGRFLSMEVTPGQEKVLSNPYVRRLLLIVVLFVATRNIVVAVGFGIIVIVLLGYLFNEKSDLCLWKSCHKELEVSENESGIEGFKNMELSFEEKQILDILTKKKNLYDEMNKKHEKPEKVSYSAYDLYSKSLSKLRSIF